MVGNRSRKSVEEFGRVNADALIAQTVELSYQLLIVEPKLRRAIRFVPRMSVHRPLAKFEETEHGSDALRVHIPYLGIIKLCGNMASSHFSVSERLGRMIGSCTSRATLRYSTGTRKIVCQGQPFDNGKLYI